MVSIIISSISWRVCSQSGSWVPGGRNIVAFLFFILVLIITLVSFPGRRVTRTLAPFLVVISTFCPVCVRR